MARAVTAAQAQDTPPNTRAPVATTAATTSPMTTPARARMTPTAAANSASQMGLPNTSRVTIRTTAPPDIPWR